MNKGRKPLDAYIDAAITVLRSFGEPMKVGNLYAQAVEEGLINGELKWSYHNFTRSIRNNPMFDTSKRGWVGLKFAAVEKEQESFEDVIYDVPSAEEV